MQVVAKELRKLPLSKKIREKKELDVDEAEYKKTLLVGFFAFANAKPPPLEEGTTPGKAKVKTEPHGKSEEKVQESGTKVNFDVSKVLKRDFKIHGVIAGDNFKDGLSFVSLA